MGRLAIVPGRIIIRSYGFRNAGRQSKRAYAWSFHADAVQGMT